MRIFSRKKSENTAHEPVGSDVSAPVSANHFQHAEHTKKRKEKNLLPVSGSNLFEADQFRGLRTKLLFPASGRRPRSIAVTGAGMGEGKSFVAANLAVCIAQNVDNRQTLLIDCDMRVPAVHRMFGFADGPGLSEYLSSDIPLASLIFKTDVDKLTILPGGTPPENPSELLSSVKMTDFLREIQSRYDDRYIVADLPSPRLVPEAELIVRQVDGTVIVAGYGKTPVSHVKELIELLGKDKILGIVFNRVDTSMHSSLYRMYRKFVRRK
ncbi:MAG: polysaccharide biosynthesis tyrosine autokinase [Desulfobacterales bacterium]